MRVIRFIRNDLPYQSGETAGFDEGKAAKFVAKGLAIYADEPVSKAPAAPGPTAQLLKPLDTAKALVADGAAPAQEASVRVAVSGVAAKP